MQKPVSIQEDLYNRLKNMKTDSLRSFTEIIQFLIDENNRLKEENITLTEEKMKFEEWKNEVQKL